MSLRIIYICFKVYSTSNFSETRFFTSSWLDSWNKRGYVGLVPNFSGGPKPKLGDAERNDLKQMIAEKDAWTLREVRELVKQKFDVEYSEMQVWRMLTSWNMYHAKPYILDKKRPDDAETILKKT
jgi:transposase